MWSANRDQDCGPNYPDVQVVSDQCSGVAQTAAVSPTSSTGSVVDGPARTPTAPSTTESAPVAPASAEADETDDPARSPYQIWNAEQAYPADTKVVWHRNVYVAKWYSMGELPDAPVADAHLTPWSLVGPVLPGEHPPVTPTLAPGHLPEVARRPGLRGWRPGAASRHRLPGQVVDPGRPAGRGRVVAVRLPVAAAHELIGRWWTVSWRR